MSLAHALRWSVRCERSAKVRLREVLPARPRFVNQWGCRHELHSPNHSTTRPLSLLASRKNCREYPLKSAARRRYASETAEASKKTPLHELHVAKGSQFVPFGGYSMPLVYDDLSHSESHHWTRENASLFDVSHMVQHKLSGPSAAKFLMQVTPTAVDQLPKYRTTLSCFLEDPSGGIVDDTVITRVGEQSYYFVTNAARRDFDLDFLRDQMTRFREKHGIKDENDLDWMVLDKHSLLALQGPKAASVLQSLIFKDVEDSELDIDLSTLHFSHARYLQLHLPKPDINTPSLLICRTGYTGEDGFEISIPPTSRQRGNSGSNSTELATQIAEAFLADPSTVRLAGLAARDSLRLEAGMCLYGRDIDLTTTPPEAGLGWVVSRERRSPPSLLTTTTDTNFNGSSKILSQLADPKTMSRRRVAMIIEKGAPPREGAPIFAIDENENGSTDSKNNDNNNNMAKTEEPKQGKEKEEEEEEEEEREEVMIGTVTSGLPSPSLNGTNIAMGLVKNGYHKKGTKLGVRVRKNIRQAEVVKLPFVANRFFRGAVVDGGREGVNE